jgi:sulfatase maturation enzyme AslB (radical SAM superfamily)
MFTDINVKFPYDGLKNCCKTNDYVITDAELASLEERGQNVLTHNAEYLRRKTDMIENNVLPRRGCDTCIQAEPNSLFRTWNTWRNRDFSNREQYLYGDNFTNYEFVLSSACDLKCVYCSDKDSSSWAKELGVPVRRGNAEWKAKILAALMDHLRNKTFDPAESYWFFFSGGEPTYNPETLQLIEQIISIVPKPNIIISTNGNTKPSVMRKYIAAVQNRPNVNWRFHCSVDGIGEHAEAIRHGMIWDNFVSNIVLLMKEPNVTVRICPTVNLYSVPRMYEFVTYFHELFLAQGHVTTDMFDSNMVQEPELSPWSMPAEYRECLDTSIEYCDMNNLDFGNHLRNVREMIGTKIDNTTAAKIQYKWDYFKSKRPGNNWDDLFPHVNDIVNVIDKRFSK